MFIAKSCLRASILPAALFIPLAAAQADECQIIVDAYHNMFKQPAIGETINQKDQKPMEMRIIGDEMHMNNGSGWTKVPASPGMRDQMMKSILPDSSVLSDCKSAGGETLNGVETQAYDYFIPEMEKLMKGAGQQRVLIGPDGLPRAMRSGDTDVVITYEGVTTP